MAKTATGRADIAITGDGMNAVLTVTLPTNAASPYQHLQHATTAAYAALPTPPTGTSFVVIIPPSGSTLAKTLKGVTGDTGVPLSTSQPSIIALAGVSVFGILATGVETLEVYYF